MIRLAAAQVDVMCIETDFLGHDCFSLRNTSLAAARRAARVRPAVRGWSPLVRATRLAWATVAGTPSTVVLARPARRLGSVLPRGSASRGSTSVPRHERGREEVAAELTNPTELATPSHMSLSLYCESARQYASFRSVKLYDERFSARAGPLGRTEHLEIL